MQDSAAVAARSHRKMQRPVERIADKEISSRSQVHSASQKLTLSVSSSTATSKLAIVMWLIGCRGAIYWKVKKNEKLLETSGSTTQNAPHLNRHLRQDNGVHRVTGTMQHMGQGQGWNVLVRPRCVVKRLPQALSRLKDMEGKRSPSAKEAPPAHTPALSIYALHLTLGASPLDR